MLAHMCPEERRKGLGREKPNTLPNPLGSLPIINPGRGHLTELVEAMPFNPGSILSPQGSM